MIPTTEVILVLVSVVREDWVVVVTEGIEVVDPDPDVSGWELACDGVLEAAVPGEPSLPVEGTEEAGEA